MRSFRLAAVLFLALSLPGCFGPFKLTKAVHTWNHDVSNDKWAREAVFIALLIIPVYSFAIFIDAIVTNPIEFFDD
jgi:hypothetical protein